MDALIWIGVILIVLWLIGWLLFHTTGFLIHLLLIIGVVLLAWWAIRRIL